MASIRKKENGRYNVIYRYKDENGISKQKWETVPDYQTAKARKAEVESKQCTNSFIIPKDTTVREFLKDYVATYGQRRWGLSMYDSNTSLIRNYINPIIGDIHIQKLTPSAINRYFHTLELTPAVSTKTRKARTKYVTAKTADKIYRLLHCAFNEAVRLELLGKNPFDNITRPKTKYNSRDIWTADTIRKALDECRDSLLYISMNLAFACSMRMGEILGLQWERVHISDKDIASDNAYIEIDRELERVSLDALKMLGQKDVYHVFKPLKPNTRTRRILKTPKSESSIRKVWLPKTVAYILKEWKNQQKSIKDLLGDEYDDFDLVVAQNNGQPCESRLLEEKFKELKEYANLPNVCFHSLRHSSTTYKLKLSHGDIKSIQGDTGHATADMVSRVYAHILDEDRKVNAQAFESAFYSVQNLKDDKPKEPAPISNLNIEALKQQIISSPELLDFLSSLISSTAKEKTG